MSYAVFNKRYWWVRKVFAEAKRETREDQRRCNALLESGSRS